MINRLWTVVVAMVVFGMVVGNVYAGGYSCPPGQSWKGSPHWKCVDDPKPEPSGTVINNTNNNDNSNSNRNTNMNTNMNTNFNTAFGGDGGAGGAGGKGGKGGDADADANVNIGGASVFGDVKTLSPEQDQDQSQDQLQGQGQEQGQSQFSMQRQSADNAGNHQTINIKEAKNLPTYNHIGAGIGKTDANLMDHSLKSEVLMNSAIFKYDNDSFIDIEEARSAMKWNGVKVVKSLISEPNVSLDTLNWGDEPTGVYFGSLTITTDSATMDQIIARGALEAMKLGATGANFILMGADSLSSTKYGIDLGGSASVAATQSGSAVIAPGSTLGWSKAKSDNKVVPELFMELFHDVSKVE